MIFARPGSCGNNEAIDRDARLSWFYGNQLFAPSNPQGPDPLISLGLIVAVRAVNLFGRFDTT